MEMHVRMALRSILYLRCIARSNRRPDPPIKSTLPKLLPQETDKGKVKRALQSLKLEGVSEVVGLQELRTDYKDFQERRKLRDGACGYLFGFCVQCLGLGWGVYVYTSVRDL